MAPRLPSSTAQGTRPMSNASADPTSPEVPRPPPSAATRADLPWNSPPRVDLAPAPGFAHRLDQAIALTPIAPGRWRGHTDLAYWNMAGPYGGFVAAVIMQALLVREDRLGDPLGLTVNFAGPLVEGPFEIEVRTPRSSRTTQHCYVEIRQGDDPATQVAVTATAVFAIRREVWSRPEAAAPKVPRAAEVPTISGRPGVRWPEMYEFRFVRGVPLQGERDDSHSVYWIKDKPDRPLDYPALASICDSAFPRIFVIRPQLTPVATVSMNSYFHGSAADLAAIGTQSVLIDTCANVFNQGFSDQQASVWSEDGRLLASTQQVVWYKA